MATRMIFQPDKLLWMPCFGFVSGHDFQAAEKLDFRVGRGFIPGKMQSNHGAFRP
jgi:hypothetical protein